MQRSRFFTATLYLSRLLDVSSLLNLAEAAGISSSNSDHFILCQELLLQAVLQRHYKRLNRVCSTKFELQGIRE